LRQLARHWLANGLTRLQAAWKLAERTGLEPVTCATLCSEAQPIESVGALAQRWHTLANQLSVSRSEYCTSAANARESHLVAGFQVSS